MVLLVPVLLSVLLLLPPSTLPHLRPLQHQRGALADSLSFSAPSKQLVQHRNGQRNRQQQQHQEQQAQQAQEEQHKTEATGRRGTTCYLLSIYDLQSTTYCRHCYRPTVTKRTDNKTVAKTLANKSQRNCFKKTPPLAVWKYSGCSCKKKSQSPKSNKIRESGSRKNGPPRLGPL